MSVMSLWEQAWNDYDGETLARLISFDDRHARNSKFHKDDDPSDAVERVLEEPIDDIVSDHLRAVYQEIIYQRGSKTFFQCLHKIRKCYRVLNSRISS